jgi:hypothetical protein
VADTGRIPLQLLLPQIVPLALAVLILQFFGFGAISGNLTAFTAPNEPQAFKLLQHYGDIILLGAAASCHICICTIATWRFVAYTHASRISGRRMLFFFGIAIFVAVMGAMIVLPVEELAVFQLTYFAIRDLIAGGLKSSPLLPDIAFKASALSISAWVLTGFGVAAVVTATMAAGVAARPLPQTGTESEAWKEQFSQRVKLLQSDLYVLSLVLVSSTINASLYFHLPVTLYSKKLQPPVAAYLDDLTLFWATIYTLTLIASIIPAYFHLRAQAKSYARANLDIDHPGEIRIWLSSLTANNAISGQIMNVAVLLAPLFAGPLGNMLQGFLSGA